MSIQIYTTNGTLVHHIPLPESKEGYASFNTNLLKSGFYFYSINSNQHSLATGKLVIAK